jgi:hypothetical protein
MERNQVYLKHKLVTCAGAEVIGGRVWDKLLGSFSVLQPLYSHIDAYVVSITRAAVEHTAAAAGKALPEVPTSSSAVEVAAAGAGNEGGSVGEAHSHGRANKGSNGDGRFCCRFPLTNPCPCGKLARCGAVCSWCALESSRRPPCSCLRPKWQAPIMSSALSAADNDSQNDGDGELPPAKRACTADAAAFDGCHAASAPTSMGALPNDVLAAAGGGSAAMELDSSVSNATEAGGGQEEEAIEAGGGAQTSGNVSCAMETDGAALQGQLDVACLTCNGGMT